MSADDKPLYEYNPKDHDKATQAAIEAAEKKKAKEQDEQIREVSALQEEMSEKQHEQEEIAKKEAEEELEAIESLLEADAEKEKKEAQKQTDLVQDIGLLVLQESPSSENPLAKVEEILEAMLEEAEDMRQASATEYHQSSNAGNLSPPETPSVASQTPNQGRG